MIYPPKCALCGSFGSDAVCSVCFGSFHPHDPALSLPTGALDYVGCLFDYTGRAAEAVQRLKYNRLTSLASFMAEQMLEGAKARNVLEVDSIVPVPIHWRRRAHRGFNQAEMLCEQLPKDLVRMDILARSRATRPQVGLSADQRSRNMVGAFTVIGNVSGRRILLVDDVLTTSGTANECASVLKAAGASEVGILTYAGEFRWRN